MSLCFQYHGSTNFTSLAANRKACSSGLCCGSEGICLSDSICLATGSLGKGVHSGYYIGGCTDSTYTSPSCSRRCASFQRQDITWINATSQWVCCGTDDKGLVDCGNPSGEVFSAPAPENLSTLTPNTIIHTSISTVSVSLSPTSTVQTSQSATPTSPSIDASSTSMGKHVGIGIGVGIAAATFVLLTLLVFVWHFRQKRRGISDHRRQGSEPGGENVLEAHGAHIQESYSQPVFEKDQPVAARYELPALDASSRQQALSPGSRRSDIPAGLTQSHTPTQAEARL